MLTIMASIAQEESRSISENVRCGKRVAFKQGKVTFAYSRFLGYKKENDKLVIDEDEAIIVRLIYRMFLVDGISMHAIAHHLNASNVKTPSGKGKRWIQNTIASILTNEKYKGDAILQKTFCTDFLTKKRVPNNGIVPQYYVENSHPPIVSKEVFDLVQHEFKRRKNSRNYTTGTSCFSSRIVCGCCEGIFGPKVWHSNSKYRRTIWQCNNKFKGEKKCATPHLDEETLKRLFVEAFNSLIEDKEAIISGYDAIIQALTDTTALDKETEKVQGECDVVLELMRKLVDENAHTALDQEAYGRRYNAYAARFEKAKKKLEKINEQKVNRQAKRENIEAFMKTIKENDHLLTEFDEELWCATVDRLIVHTTNNVTVIFKDGMELPWNI